MTTIKPKNSTSSRTPRAARDAARQRAGQRQTESLWRHFRRTRSAKTRNQLIERYRPLVEAMASSMAARLPRSVDVQDLTHAGVWGLMRAIENFEPERGNNFTPFMRMRVRGAMLDELRSLDYVPRLVRHRRRALDAARFRLRGELDRAPTDAELADELGVTETALRTRFSLSPPGGARMDDADLDRLEGLVDEGTESPGDALQRRDLLAKIKASLQPIEWQVLELHYIRGLSGKEIARRLHLSASRICQIHGRVLSRLKARLEPLR